MDGVFDASDLVRGDLYQLRGQPIDKNTASLWENMTVFRSLQSVFVATVVAAGAVGQGMSEEPIKTTLCDIVRGGDLARFLAAGCPTGWDFHGSRSRVGSPGIFGTLGDNGPATSAYLIQATGVAVDSAGNLYISDEGETRIRKVSNGIITTIAGNGSPGFGGDDGPATGALLNFPRGVAVDANGNVYVADTENNRIRLLTPSAASTCSYSVTPTSLQAEFGELQALPTDGKPITSASNRDEAWNDVARGIRRVIDEIRSSSR